MFKITELSVEECLVIARHIYLKSEDIEKTLCVQAALEHIFIDLNVDASILHFGNLHFGNFSAYTLVRHAFEISHSIANDQTLLSCPADKLWAEKFEKCAKELAKLF